MEQTRQEETMDHYNHNEKLSEIIATKGFTEVKGTFGLGNKEAYQSNEVDHFLTEVQEAVEKLEYDLTDYAKTKEFAEKLYDWYKEHKAIVKAHKEGKDAGIPGIEVSGSDSENVTRLQKNMADLLAVAQQRADEISFNAYEDAKTEMNEAKARANQIVADAQAEAERVNAESLLKVQEANRAKEEIELKMNELKEDVRDKSQEISKLAMDLSGVSSKLKDINNQEIA